LDFIRPAGSYFLPDPAYRPRKPAYLSGDSGAEPSQPASENGGSGKDSYVNYGAQRRYGCAQDGLYLKSGDGWVESVRKGETGDSISMRDPGDGLLFKVAGRMGRRIRLELIVCGEAGNKRINLMTLRGGSGVRGPYPDLIAEPDWVRPGVKGDTLSFSPIKIPSDPYYLELSQVHTYDDSLYYSFDGYKAWSD
jgi:hypothetical protein